MRFGLLLTALLVAGPVSAQVSIDSHGVRSGGVRIDATGVHSGNADVSRHGIRAGGTRGGGGTTINGNGGARTVDCRGGALTVNGNRNRITARECRSISLAGNRNALRWHTESGHAAVTNVGNGNSVVRF